jgi:hypothetical protein
MSAAEFACLDQSIGDGSGFAPDLRPREQVIIAFQSEVPNGAFDCFVVQFEKAEIQIGSCLGPTVASLIETCKFTNAEPYGQKNRLIR